LALVDARMRKRAVPERQRGLAPLTVGLCPNFVAGDTVDLAIGTMWGDRLGKVIEAGATLPLAGEPRPIGGVGRARFVCTQAVLPAMRERKWGRTVNISSGAARGAGAIGVHYNASKSGMEGLTRGYAARLVKEGITVNAVAPSLIETGMMRARRDKMVPRIPLGRMGYPEEVAQAVLMVIGNPYMTGQTVQLNGGTNFI
jgi:NAD(P)-dependent dehydrogenase (short-subunit alcohol dehydrogenase family)